MKTFTLVVQPKGAALSVGGQSEPRYGGHKATARDPQGRLVIPATALRGALRIELERLLRGKGELPCSAHPESDGPAIPTPCSCAVSRLFGQGGSATGTLRLEDARFGGDDLQGRDVVLRPQVAVSRRTGTAAENHLLFQETSPVFEATGAPTFQAAGELVLRGQEDSLEDLEEDFRNLQAACRALRAVGGAKARGLGWVECGLQPSPQAPVPGGEGLPDGDSVLPLSPGERGLGGEGEALLLTLEALAPLHFGTGPARDFFHPTQDFAASSTVQGALAFALLEQGLARAEDVGFQALFGEESPATFGSARLPGHQPSETLRVCRPEEHVFDDLVALLLRRQALKHGIALAAVGSPCPVEGCRADKASATDRRAGAPVPLRRVRTRTSINRRTGTAMDQRLYSQEVLEPRLVGEEGKPLTLQALLRGLTPEGLRLLAKLDGGTLRLGGKRSKGMGLCRVSLRPAAGEEEAKASARRAYKALTRTLRQGWEELGRVAEDLPASPLEKGCQALAIVLTEPWFSGPDQAGDGPLGAQISRVEGKPLATFLRTTQVGRFAIAEARRWGAKEVGERPPRQAVAAGAVYVYQVPTQALIDNLSAWVRQGQRGDDPNGYGRFEIRGPEDVFEREGES